MRSQSRRRRRWKRAKNKMQQERDLEEFRNFRTSKRRTQKKNKEATKKKKLKLRFVLYVPKILNEKQSNQVATETERKHLVEF